ncbi:Rpp14/Pop5 family protein [Halobacteriales archaeon Cl-PHB]
MKHLPKHLRPRWRYLAVELEGWPDAGVGRSAFQRELWFAAQNLVGDVGSAEVDLQVLRFAFDEGAGTAVVRTRRDAVEAARAVLACVSEVDGAPVSLRIMGVSGTVRACEEKYIGRGTEDPDQRHVVFENAERRAVTRAGTADVRVDEAFAGATDLDLQ